MCPTVSFKVRTDEEKDISTKAINEISDRFSEIDNKGQAFMKLISLFNEGFKPPSDDAIGDSKRAMEQVNCDFLRYEGEVEGFICNEYFHTKKKGNPLGHEPQLILMRCYDCRRGKQIKKQQEIDKKLQQDSFRKILDFRKTFMQALGDGIEADVFLCKGSITKDSSFQISVNSENMTCPLIDDDLVTIEDFCKQKINKATGLTPCRHLIIHPIRPKIQLHDVNLTPEQYREEIKQMLPSLEYDPITEDRPDGKPKIIEVEAVIKDEDKKEGDL